MSHRARKRFGQHFLVSSGAVARIVQLAEIGPGSRVLEIGPGLGALTEALVATGATVVAVELDRDLAAVIRERFPTVRLIEGDALRIDFADELGGGGWQCVANLPYNVGTRLMTRMLDLPDTFERLVLMLQREVAERIVAAPGDRVRGSLSVFAQVRATAAIKMRLRPGSFRPPPKVASAVVDLRLFPAPRIGSVDPEGFERVVRAAFSAPRKTVRNALAGTYGSESASEALDAVQIDPRRRASTLDLDEFRALATRLETDSCE